MQKVDIALMKYTFMYKMGGNVKNAEFYKLEPYLDGPAGMLVVQDLATFDADSKRLWRAILFWPVSKAEIVFDEMIHAPAGADADSVAATALGFFTLREGDTDSEYFDTYNELQLTFRDQHAETVGALAYKGTDDSKDGESLSHLRIP